MPECVTSWPLEQLELHFLDTHWICSRITDQIIHSAKDALAAMVGRLAGTLRELKLIEFANYTFLADLPPMPHLAKCILRCTEDDYINAPNRSYTVGPGKMPAIEYLEGITHFDTTLFSLPLHHLRLVADYFTFRCELETPMLSLLSLVIEGTPKDGSVRYMHRFPEWFGGEIFPNLQELHVWHLDEMAYLPASIASFTALTELSLLEVGFNNQGEYERETHMATSILDPSILQITTLRTLNILHCDFKTLPAFFMPSLKFMRISACENLYEFPELSVRALPQLAVLELHKLESIRTLPESLGELTALTRLHISECHLESMPMSMQKLSALRELTIHSSLVPTDSNSLLRDVAFSLKGLHSLRKLCLSGPYSFCAEDLIFIGLSLKAWPLPFLDIMDNKYPILGFRVSPQTRYKGHFVDPFGEPGCEDYCDLPADPAPFAFKRFWRALGLPTEAADWDDGQIVQHWRTMQLKIEAFACIQHSRLCPESLPDLPAETVAMIGHVAADWQRQHFRENEQQRMSEREQAASRENATRLADMRHFEHLLLLECRRDLLPENTAAAHARQNETIARRHELQRLQETETGTEPKDECRARQLEQLASGQKNEIYHNAYLCRVREDERARMLTRMQELEPQQSLVIKR